MRNKLRVAIDKMPRVLLGNLPTPLQSCPRFSKALGGPQILIKRDDLTGLALGGNKTRQLEFVMADACKEKSNVIVVGAGSQSNLCCQVAAAGNKLGIKPVLVLSRDEKAINQGNLLLDRIFGGEIRFIESDNFEEIFGFCERVASDLNRSGDKAYVINPWGDSGSLAAIGYTNAALELDEQFKERGFQKVHIYTAATDATPAGLILGFKEIGANITVTGISPALSSKESKHLISRLANGAADLLGLDTRVSPNEVKNLDTFVGESYGKPTADALKAISLLAETEGILLDPIYTGRAMAALIDHVRSGHFSNDETVVFIHTGGLPLNFAYADELTSIF